jgi:hypothetical protein
MSALAAAYTQTFQPVGPLQGTVFDNGSDVLLGQMPMQTAALMAPLAQQALRNEADLIGTTLNNRQRTLEMNTEVAFREKQRKDLRKQTLADRLLQTASGIGRSGAKDWAMGQVFAPQGDGLSRAGNRYGTAMATFEGAQAANAPLLQTYLDAVKGAGAARSSLPAPTTRS